MKVICSRDRLIESVAIVQKAVSSRSTMAILDGILIEANENLKLTGYDQEIGIECQMEADIPEKGSLVVTSRMFGDIIRKLPEDLITLESTSAQTLQIESGSSHFSIKYLKAEDYPKIPVVEPADKVTLEQQLLKDMIRQTIFAVSTDETRPTLNGCFFHSEASSVEMVAIDGFRLALRKQDVEGERSAIKLIIPGKVLHELGRILEAGKEKVDIYPSNNNILFDTGSVKIVSRLIQGEYMNYRGILPQTAETTLTISPSALLDAIERASLVITTDDKRYPVRLTTSDEDTLVVSASTDIGTLREEIAISMNGQKIDIDFNPRYFIDALKVIDEDEITIVFNGTMGPCVIKPIDSQEFAYLVLPLRR
ncbi:MAG: DNA polymerase III subunit beta [Eubacteriales bacterium]|nr:DNA polymerase III subunit beta [Kiritimatiellia bacterium]MDD4743115.1 DNA polymerase III subunit beta [Eubacteriales bacterium]NLV85451.1 DNA polymerase III subunit beta [Spirochaetales bacterium]